MVQPLLYDASIHGDVCLIGGLLAEVGLEPKTIRFYEQAGLIKPRRLGRFRVFDHEDAERLKVIKFLRRFDLSVQIIRKLLQQHQLMHVDNLPEDARHAIVDRLQQRRDEIALLEILFETSKPEEA